MLGLSETAVAAGPRWFSTPPISTWASCPADYLGAAGLESAVDLLTTDWDGSPVTGSVEVIFYEREWQPQRRQSRSEIFNWVPVDTEVDRVSVTTDDQGKAQPSSSRPPAAPTTSKPA